MSRPVFILGAFCALGSAAGVVPPVFLILLILGAVIGALGSRLVHELKGPRNA